MRIIKAPHKFLPIRQPSIFLAGSIEMGKAENWQDKITKKLASENVLILNPRRDDWDSSWEQSIDNLSFRTQVLWELKAQESVDIIIMYFDPKTKSPISLLELGLFASTDKMIVCCPNGFWRKGNVDIVCKRYGVMLVDTLEDLISATLIKLSSLEDAN